MSTETRYYVKSNLRSAQIVVAVRSSATGPTINAFLRHDNAGMLAFAGERPPHDCRVEVNSKTDASLWIGSTAFDLPRAEGLRIAEALGIKAKDISGGAA